MVSVRDLARVLIPLLVVLVELRVVISSHRALTHILLTPLLLCQTGPGLEAQTDASGDFE